MLNERRKSILSLIKQNEEIKINELTNFFPDVSEMTIRRDLDFLATNNLVYRTHGGAKALRNSDDEHEFSERLIANIHPKMSVAKNALRLLEQGRSIYFDAGSTLLSLMEIIPNINLFAITNAPNIALELIKKDNAEVILLGGNLNKNTISITSPFSLELVDKLNIDIAFMSTGGFSLESGFTNPYINECELKQKVINKAKKVIMLMDHTKINRNLAFTFAKLSEIDIFVTDKELPKNISDVMNRHGIEIIY